MEKFNSFQMHLMTHFSHQWGDMQKIVGIRARLTLPAGG